MSRPSPTPPTVRPAPTPDDGPTTLEARAGEAGSEPWLEPGSPAMRTVLALLARAAAHDVPVLLRGEAGSGKGLLARALHDQGPRRARPFVTVPCSLSAGDRQAADLFGRAGEGAAGLLEQAAPGTAFLDEVGALSLDCQARLVRLLQSRDYERVGEAARRPLDVRLVASTQRDLEAEVAAGRFRQDLLSRLNVLELGVPPLRQRAEDVLPLARWFLASFAREARRACPAFSRAAERALTGWSWPGNVRELRNVVERALILTPGEVIEPEVFPERMLGRAGGPPQPGGDFTAEAIEQEHVMRVVARTATMAEASRILGLDVTTLWRKRKKWGR